VIAALSALAEAHPTRGFDKYRQALARSHPQWNKKRIYRVYCLLGLNLRPARRRRLPKRERVALSVPEHLDRVWSADFMSDALICGRGFRTFNVTDDFNREGVHIEIDISITAQRLVRVFEQIRRERPLPQVLLTDNGPEFLGEVFVQ
jgi:putative transposase